MCQGRDAVSVVASSTCFFFFKQKTAYEIPKRDWSSDVCSSDLSRNERLVMVAVHIKNVDSRYLAGIHDYGISEIARTVHTDRDAVLYGEAGDLDVTAVTLQVVSTLCGDAHDRTIFNERSENARPGTDRDEIEHLSGAPHRSLPIKGVIP